VRRLRRAFSGNLMICLRYVECRTINSYQISTLVASWSIVGRGVFNAEIKQVFQIWTVTGSQYEEERGSKR